MFLYLISIFIIFFVCTYLYFKIFIYSYWTNQKVDTVKPSFPFGNLGQIFLGQNGLGDTVKNCYDKCIGEFAGIYLVTSPALIVKDPNLIKHVFVKDFNHFTDRGMYMDETKEPTSCHLFRLNGERWRNVRNKLTPAFTAGKLKIMFGTITQVADKLKLYLTKECQGTIVNVEDVSTRFNADIIASVFFGIECNSFEDKNNDFIVMAKDLFVSESYFRIARAALQTFFPNVLKYFKIETVKKAQDQFIFNLVENVIKYREENGVTRCDLMQLLIQLKNKGRIDSDGFKGDDDEICLSLNEISAQAYSFFWAGYETSSSTMNFLLYECALDQNLQKKLQENIDVVLNKYGGCISYESISEMDYVNRAIDETLRKYPILPFVTRICTKDYKIPESNVMVKKGMRLLVSISGLHHDPIYYPEPEKFDPDRFITENVQKRHQFSYLPFGEGPRNCLGKRIGKMMVAVGIATLLRNFKVDICKNTDIPLKYNHLAFFIKTTRPIHLQITKR